MEELTKHVRSQIDLNFALLLYSTTTEIAVAYHSQSPYAVASIVYMSGEIAYRLYSIHQLRRLKSSCESDVNNRPPEIEGENERVPFVFQDSIEEVGYDDQKESFTHGRQKSKVVRGK